MRDGLEVLEESDGLHVVLGHPDVVQILKGLPSCHLIQIILLISYLSIMREYGDFFGSIPCESQQHYNHGLQAGTQQANSYDM